jgi:hypothetical protein
VVLLLFLLPPFLCLSTAATWWESWVIRMQGRRHLAAIVASPKVASEVSRIVKCSSSPYPS